MAEQTFIVGTVVAHKPGVLHKISNMFRRRDFNIESISVGPTEEKELARMTITLNGNEQAASQLVKQLEKLIDVACAAVLDFRGGSCGDIPANGHLQQHYRL